MDVTILAAVPGALPDPSPFRFVNHLRCGAEDLPSLALEDGHKLVCTDITLVLRSLAFSELPFGRFTSQFFNTRLQFRIGAELKHRLRFIRQKKLQHGMDAPVKGRHFRYRCHGPMYYTPAPLCKGENGAPRRKTGHRCFWLAHVNRALGK